MSSYICIVEIERIYGEYHLPMVDAVHQFVNAHREPVDAFDAKNRELYELRLGLPRTSTVTPR